MANRYWIRGSGNWSDPSHWSTSSGGAWGASVPTNVDDVYFDASSFSATSTVTITANASCLSFNCSDIDASVTLSNSSSTLYISGDLILSSRLITNFPSSAGIYLTGNDASKYITCNNFVADNDGISVLKLITFNGTGSTWINTDDFILCNGSFEGAEIVLLSGTWNTNDQSISILGLNSQDYSEIPRTLNLGNSNFYVSRLYISGLNNYNNSFIINFGSSHIYSHDYIGGSWEIGGRALNNATIYAGYFNSFIDNDGYNESAPPIFNNLTIKTFQIDTENLPDPVLLATDISVNNLLTLEGHDSSISTNFRLQVFADPSGTPANVYAADVSAAYVELRDIHAVGSVPWNLIDTNSSDLGGNSNILFEESDRNRYWIGGSGNWSDASHWSTSSGGAWGASIPTKEHNVIFDASSHLGPELIQNNTFDNSTWWGLSDSSIADGVVHIDCVNNGWKVYSSGLYTIGNKYKGRYQITDYTSGQIDMYPAGARTSASTYNEQFTASTTTGGFLAGDNTILDIDNVYIREVRSLNVTLDVSANCRTMDWSDIDVSAQITSSVNSAYIYGDFILNASLYWRFSGTGYTYLVGDTSMNMYQNNAPMLYPNRFYINKTSLAAVNHRDRFYTTNEVYMYNSPTWITNDNSIYLAGMFTVSNLGGHKAMYLGSSDVFFGNGICNYSTDISLYAGTSLLTIAGDWLRSDIMIAFNNIIFNMNRAVGGHVGNITCNNFIINGLNAATSTFRIISDISVNELLTIKGYDSSTSRTLMYSNTTGTYRRIYANDVSIINVDFRDISVGGTANWDLSNIPGGSGDCGGNSGITFTTPASCYFVSSSTNAYISDASRWRTSSGGSTYSRMPLPQDDLLFDENSFSGNTILSLDILRLGSVNMDRVDTSISLNTPNDVQYYGDFILNSSIYGSSEVFSYLYGRNNHYIKFPSFSVSILDVRCAANASYTLLSNLNVKGSLRFNNNNANAVFDFNNFDVSASWMWGSNSNLLLRNGTFTFTGDYAYSFSPSVSCGNSTIIFNCHNSAVANPIISGGGAYFNKVILGGTHTGNYIITGSNTFNELVINPTRKVNFTAGTAQTINNSFIALGTPDASITISSTTPGSKFLLNATNTYVRIANAYISDASVSPAEDWIALDSSDLGGNSGITFTDQPYEYIDYYWVGNGGNWSDVSHWAPTSGGTPAAYTITSSDNLIFDANSFDASATVYADVSSFRSIRMTNIDNSIYFMPYNDLYCNGDFALSPRVEFLFSSYYNFYFYGIGDCSLCTGGINFLSHLFSFKTGNYILYDNLIQNPYSSTAQILLGDDASLDLNNYDIITSYIHEDWDANGGGHLYLRNGMLSTQRVDFYRLRIFPGNSTIKLISNFWDGTADQNTTWGDFSGAIKQYNKIRFSGTPNTDYVYNMDVVYPLQVNINILEIDPGIKVKFDANDYGYIKVYNVSTFIAHGTSNASIGIFSKTSDQQFKLNYTGDSDVQADYLYVQDCSATPANIWSAGNHGVDLGNNSGWKFRHHRDIPPVYYRNLLLNKFRYDDVWGIVQSDPYIAQYMSVYNAMTTKPDASLALAQDTMITSLVNANLYDRFDLLYILASHTNDASEAYLDWINPTGAFNLKDPNATNPTFQAYRGVTGDDATDWLDTDFIPVQHCTNTSTNSFTLGVYINTINAGGVAFGAFSADTPYCRTSIQPVYSTVQQRAYINSEIIVTSAIVPSVSTGLHLATRTASDQVNIYMHDVCTGTSTVASNRANSTALSLLAQKITDGTHDNFFGSQVAIAFLIDGVNNDDVSILNNIFSTYVNTISDYA